ncbi:MAG: hypothetical protein Q7T37_01475 [bacterium]|nr:hypothetical protein [bacterium]MDO8742304.1 hypothetical protein [bacterium]
MKKTKKTKGTSKTAMEIGAGLVAVGAAAAAGYYFYGSKKAKSHRKIAAKWAVAMKNDVIKEAKHLEKTSPKAFAAIVDRVAETYRGARAVDVAEVKRAAKELKANWEIVQREAKRTVRKSVSRARAAVKRIK